MTNLYAITIISFLIFLSFSLYEKKILQKKNNLQIPNFKFNPFFYYVILLFYVLFTQGQYLNYETIDWDTNSYLVSSQDVLRGNLPYENQWESKQSLFYYIYAILILISNGNLIIFKLLNDFLLYLLSIILFLIVKVLTNDQLKSFLASILFLTLMSQPWSSTEFSEIYSLIFISLGFYILISRKLNRQKLFFIGVLISSATLVNVGSALFVFPFLFSKRITSNLKNFIYFCFGGIVPHLLFSTIYFSRNLIDIYWSTLFVIPNAYRGEQMNFAREFINFLRSLNDYNQFLYLIFIFLLSSLFADFLTSRKLTSKINMLKNTYLQFLFISILFYYLASHGYYHHLIFFIFFLPLLIKNISGKISTMILILLISVSSGTILFSKGNLSFTNISNLNLIYENYPLNKLAKEIDSKFDDDYEILAFDSLLILYYLDKPNFSYIVHPTNHNEEFITDNLRKLNLITKDEPERLVNLEPDVIMCSNNSIIQCEIYDYKKNYYELDSLVYRQDPLLQFYDNQTFQFRVFLKES